MPSSTWSSHITYCTKPRKTDALSDHKICIASPGKRSAPSQSSLLLSFALAHFETLSELHTMANHRYWRLIHGELSRLASPKWQFICINGKKCFRTMWKDLAIELPKVFDLCAEQTLWNTARKTEMKRPLPFMLNGGLQDFKTTFDGGDGGGVGTGGQKHTLTRTECHEHTRSTGK